MGSADTDDDDHIYDLIYQVLFTSPGERVNRPEFGCGLKQMVFLPNSDALATATQQLVAGSLQRWLGEVIAVEKVEGELLMKLRVPSLLRIKRLGGFCLLAESSSQPLVC